MMIIKNKDFLDFILGLLTAAGLVSISKAIPLNIELFLKLTGKNQLPELKLLSSIFMLIFIVLIGFYLNLRVKFSKVFKYSFWFFLILGYLLYLYNML